MESDDGHALRGQPEHVVQLHVADARPGPAEEHHAGGLRADRPDPHQVFREIALVHDVAVLAGVVLVQVVGRRRDGREDTPWVDGHIGGREVGGQDAPGLGRGVGDEPEVDIVLLQPADALNRPRQRSPGRR
jgi:hypothetical protein